METVSGGAYIVNGKWVNAQGEPLSDETIRQLEAQDDEDQNENSAANREKPYSRMNKTELLEAAKTLGITVDDTKSKAEILALLPAS